MMMMNEEQKKTAPEMATPETESKDKIAMDIVTETEEKSKHYLFNCLIETIIRQAHRNRLRAQWPLQTMGLETMMRI